MKKLRIILKITEISIKEDKVIPVENLECINIDGACQVIGEVLN